MEKDCREYIAGSTEEMSKLAAEIAGILQGGDLLLLRGDLGAGKTTFVQALAQALGVTQDVTSPTFTVVAQYDVPNNPQIQQLVHVDLYRLEGPDPIIQEVLEQSHNTDTVTAIEWAEKLGKEIPGAITMHFKVGGRDSERQVTICS